MDMGELLQHMSQLKKAGLLDSDNKDTKKFLDEWVDFMPTYIEEVNSGDADPFVWIMMKILMDHRKAKLAAGVIVPAPPFDNMKADLSVANRAALSTSVNPRDMLSPANKIPRAVIDRDGFNHHGYRYSRSAALGKVFRYPALGSFGMMRNRLVKITKINRTNIDAEALEGPAAVVDHQFHSFQCKLDDIPSDNFEGHDKWTM